MDTSKIDPETLAKYIDHTMLKPDATLSQIGLVCAMPVGPWAHANNGRL